MINIRKNTFETNSSSTHSIVIVKDEKELDIPDKMTIHLEEDFGWDYRIFNSAEDKLEYLIFGIIDSADSITEAIENIEKLVQIVKKWVNKIYIKGIKLELYSDKFYISTEGYLDHGNYTKELLDNVLNNEELLKRFLFSPLSFIATGNDNEEGYPTINVDYEYDEFLKGN